jgi:Arc/MetJ family transcription regulator
MMRTNVEIDDKLMAAAMKATKAKTKKEAIRMALEQMIASGQQQEIRKLRGKVNWQGDLDAWHD